MQDVSHSKKRILSTLLLVMATSVLFLYNWTIEVAETMHVKPAMEQCDNV